MSVIESLDKPAVPKNRDGNFMRSRTGKARGGRPAKKIGSGSPSGEYDNSSSGAPDKDQIVPVMLNKILREPVNKKPKPRTKLETVLRGLVDAAMSGTLAASTRILDMVDGKPGRSAPIVRSTGESVETVLAETEKRWLAEATEAAMAETEADRRAASPDGQAHDSPWSADIA